MDDSSANENHNTMKLLDDFISENAQILIGALTRNHYQIFGLNQTNHQEISSQSVPSEIPSSNLGCVSVNHKTAITLQEDNTYSNKIIYNLQDVDDNAQQEVSSRTVINVEQQDDENNLSVQGNTLNIIKGTSLVDDNNISDSDVILQQNKSRGRSHNTERNLSSNSFNRIQSVDDLDQTKISEADTNLLCSSFELHDSNKHLSISNNRNEQNDEIILSYPNFTSNLEHTTIPLANIDSTSNLFEMDNQNRQNNKFNLLIRETEYESLHGNTTKSSNNEDAPRNTSSENLNLHKNTTILKTIDEQNGKLGLVKITTSLNKFRRTDINSPTTSAYTISKNSVDQNNKPNVSMQDMVKSSPNMNKSDNLHRNPSTLEKCKTRNHEPGSSTQHNKSKSKSIQVEALRPRKNILLNPNSSIGPQSNAEVTKRNDDPSRNIEQIENIDETSTPMQIINREDLSSVGNSSISTDGMNVEQTRNEEHAEKSIEFVTNSNSMNHNGKKEFTCAHCNKSFKWKISMKMHIIFTHSDEQPFACTICPSRFKTNYQLSLHIVWHSDKRPFKCTTCPKKFKRKNHLNRHVMNVHVKGMEVACDICGKVFQTLNYLKVHIGLVHNDKRPFKCTTCSKTYNRRWDLNKHVKQVHVKGMQVACEICGKMFKTYYLKIHIRQVHNDERFECPHCEKKLKTKVTLERHVRRHLEA